MADDIELGVADYLANPEEPVLPRLKDSLFYGVQQQPDTVAQMRRYSAQIGVPAPAAEADPKYVQAQGKVHELDPNGMVLTAPKTADWLATPENAAVAHDDTPVLKKIEQGVVEFGKNFPNLLKAAGLGVVSGAVGTDLMISHVFDKIVDPFNQINPAGREAQDKAEEAYQAKVDAQTAAVMPKSTNMIGAGVNSAVVSTAQNLPMMIAGAVTGNAGMALAGMGAIQGGQAYGQAREAGASRDKATGFGLGQGAVEVATEMLPMHVLLGDVAHGSGLLKTIAHQLASELPTEELAQHLQDLNEWVTLHPEKTLKDYIAEEPDRFVTTAIATILQSGATGAGAHLAGRVLQKGQEKAQGAQENVAQAQAVEGLVKAAQASALRQRDPSTFHDYVQAVTQDTPAEYVYVNANDLVNTLGQGSPEQIAQNIELAKAMPSVPGQLEDALPSNGLVRIPVSELLAYTPDTPLAQGLIEHLKVDPEGFSMKEAEAFMQSQAEDLKTEVGKAVEQGANLSEFEASQAKVHEALLNQINQVNRFTPDVNAQYAQLPASFYATSAARMGVTPEAMYTMHTLTVQAAGVGPDALAQVPPDVAKGLNYETRIPDDPKFAEAVANTPGAELTEDGLHIELERHQKPEQSGDESARTGVFYLPKKSANARHYRRQGPGQYYGGGEKVAGATLLRAPLFVKGPTGGKAPEAAYETLKGKGSMKKLDAAIMHVIGGMPALKKDGLEEEAVSKLLEEQGGDPTLAYQILHTSQKGNQLRYALQEHIIAHAVRAAGHDAVVGYSTTKSGPAISEVFDVREAEYPTPDGGFGLHDQFMQSDAHFSYEPGLGFQSALFNTVRDAKQAKASADQWLATLRNTPGVKKEEIEWIGLPEALKLMGAQGAVTKEQVLTYIAQNGVRLEEVVNKDADEDAVVERADALRQAAMDEYLNGLDIDGEDEDAWDRAREDAEERFPWAEFREQAADELTGNRAEYGSYTLPAANNYRELLLTLPKRVDATPTAENGRSTVEHVNPRLAADFTGGHWSDPNVMAHARLSDRTGLDGKRVLFVEEIQSDWHQKGRQEGYAVAASPEEIADAKRRYEGAQAETRAAFSVWTPKVLELAQRMLPLKLAELKQARDAADAAYAVLPEDKPALRDSREYEEAYKRYHELTAIAGYTQNGLDELKSTIERMQSYSVEGNGSVAADSVRAGNAADRFLADIRQWPEIDTSIRDERTELKNERADISRLVLAEREAQAALDRKAGTQGIPDAPFKASWAALVMKRLVKLAVEEGYHQVAWIHGNQQNGGLTAQEEGVKVFYDLNMVGVANDVIKKFGAKVEPTPVGFNRFSKDGQGNILYRAERDEFTAQHERELDERLAMLTEQVRLAEQAGDEERKKAWERDARVIKADIARFRLLTPSEQEQAAFDAEHPRLVAAAGAAAQAHEKAKDDFTAARRNTDPDVKNAASAALETTGQAWNRAMGELYTLEAAFQAARHFGFEITEKMKAEDAATQPPLFQGDDPAKARGAFNPQTNTITLLRNADLSTFLHETGHFFLETLAHMAADPAAPQEIKDDWNKAASFIGFGGADPAAWLAIPVDARRDGHETWARGFEAYLREGKAPSLQLQGAFHRFRAWLLHIYQSLTQLNVELTDEVRGVFSRLLATDAEIAQAEQSRAFAPVFATRPEGMTETEWTAYQRLGEEATEQAQDELQSRSIRDMRWLQNTRMRMIRQLAAEARDKRKAIRAEVEAEVRSEPVYAAMDFLKRGNINGEPSGLPHKLSIQEVEALYADNPGAPWQNLGYGKYGMLANSEGDNAIHPDQAAELFGFTSGDHMVRELLAAHPMREEIEGRTDQRMLERYGDLTDPDAIARAADEAIHNDARLRFVATEANALAKAAGSRRILAEAARNYARELVSRQRVRDLKPAKYTGAEARAAVASARAAGKGDLVTAATEKRNQLINGYAAKAAFEAQAEVEKVLRMFDRLQGKGALKSIDAGYRDQIDQLLERFDLRKGQSLKAIDRRTSLAAWVKSREDAGLPPPTGIDDDLLNEAYRKHYKNMTVEELRGLRDAVQNIAHLGRLKNRLLVAARGRAFQSVVDEAEALIREKAYKTLPDNIEHNTVADRVLSNVASFFAIHRKMSSLFREMSGFKSFDGGVLWRAFIEPMNVANDREAAMRADATKALGAIYSKLPTQKDALRRKLYIPEIGRSMTLEGRLAVALNWGNELNRARIMDGDKWTQEQAEAVLRTLSPEHLTFVNEVWTYLDSYWPQVAALERRVNGVEPEKVEAEPFELTAQDGSVVQMRGGYYPIVYDPERSSRSEADQKAEVLRSGVQRAYAAAQTRRGHTKARVDKVERPVRKDILVPFGHVNQVIHDLSFREYLMDAERLIRAPQIEAAIRDHYGVQPLRTIRDTLGAIAEGEQPAADALERAVNYVRMGSTIAGLGFNLVSAVQQPLGLAQSVARIGPKYMAVGVGKAFTDAASLNSSMKAIAAKSDFMRLRGQTLMREVSEIQNQVKQGLKPKPLTAVEGGFFYLTAKLQLVADVPTWLGAYDKAVANGEDDLSAVHLADQAVRDSQGSGQTGDLAQIQRGNAWFKLWTNFYSFFNVAYNQLAESVAETRRVGPSRLPILAADFLLVAVVPSVFGDLLKHALRGDDWQWDKIGASLAKAQVAYLLGFMVGARELGTIITSDGKGPAAPAGLRLLTSDLPNLYRQVEQGEWDDSLRRALINTGGVLTHSTSAQINRTIDGIEALAKGETTNPLAPLFGPPQIKKP